MLFKDLIFFYIFTIFVYWPHNISIKIFTLDAQINSMVVKNEQVIKILSMWILRGMQTNMKNWSESTEIKML